MHINFVFFFYSSLPIPPFLPSSTLLLFYHLFSCPLSINLSIYISHAFPSPLPTLNQVPPSPSRRRAEQGCDGSSHEDHEPRWSPDDGAVYLLQPTAPTTSRAWLRRVERRASVERRKRMELLVCCVCVKQNGMESWPGRPSPASRNLWLGTWSEAVWRVWLSCVPKEEQTEIEKEKVKGCMGVLVLACGRRGSYICSSPARVTSVSSSSSSNCCVRRGSHYLVLKVAVDDNDVTNLPGWAPTVGPAHLFDLRWPRTSNNERWN